MTIVKSAFRGGMWLSAFTFVSQAISWGATLVVARLLSPADYGLMAMATILTGYVEIFYELGIGAAIIQREHVSDEELSSVFWVLVFWGSALSLSCLFLAYPTVAIFDEPRLLRVTQAVSVLFVLGATFIVPSTLLRRQLRFKALGLATSVAVIVSCLSMIAMAYLGAGVWTLIGGNIVRSVLSVLLVFWTSGWLPRLHCRHHEALTYLRFGLPLAVASSLRYVYTRAAVLFGGRVFLPDSLGQYSLAIQLAVVPDEKLFSLINGVSYPVFSRLRNDDSEFRQFFVNLSQITALIVLPLYSGGFFLAGDLIPWVLGPKWEPSVLPFQLLCIAFIFSTITNPVHLANTAQGRPLWAFWFQAVCAVTMTVGFYLSAASGVPGYLAIPWIAIYAPAQVVYWLIVLRKLGISPRELLAKWRLPALGTFSMLLMLSVFRYGLVNIFPSFQATGGAYVLLSIGLGAAWYACFLMLLQRDVVYSIFRLARSS